MQILQICIGCKKMGRNENNKRTKIFISYSHKDARWLGRLRVHLRPLIRDQEIDIWDDTLITPGSSWRHDIKSAVESARVAILLVSADFLASNFIATNELTPLLQAARTEGATILPVIISPSGFEEDQNISQFQAVNDPRRPLINLRKGEQEAIWVKVVDAIKSSLSISPATHKSPVNDQTTANQLIDRRTKQRNSSRQSLAAVLPADAQPGIKTSSRLIRYLRISIPMLLLIGVILATYLFTRDLPVGELMLEADEAAIHLDLTSDWVELNEVQRKTQRISKAPLYGRFILRKYDENATFTHRLGTSSVVPNPLDWDSSHSREARPTTRKCAAEVTTTYMLYFDISNERVNVPFELKYRIDFWNAHNGEKGDWHQFYVSSPTKVLTFRVSFPKNKPYTKLYFLSGEGGDCSQPPLPHENPIFVEWTDEKTGAKNMSWTIQNPRTHWVYKIRWDW